MKKHYLVSDADYKPDYRWVHHNGKQMLEHRYLMEQYLGRLLANDEIVHHKDGNKLNNDLANLELMSRSAHISHHSRKNLPIEEIRQLFDQGLTTGQIAKLFDCSIDVIRHRLHALGYKNWKKRQPPLPKRWDRAIAKQMLAAGLNIPTIAKHFGVTKEAIYFARKNGEL